MQRAAFYNLWFYWKNLLAINHPAFQIIPVIDLMHGQVVAAKQGMRASYRPIQSGLCQSHNIFDILPALLKISAFKTFYIADLDALALHGNQNGIIREILQQFPDHDFWIDRGIPGDNILLQAKNYSPVIGSESLNDENYHQLRKITDNFILSLDYAADQSKMGSEKIFIQHDLWPEKIILMTLAKVGSNSGPDFQKLAVFQSLYPEKQFIAAGGIRNYEDLRLLQNQGIHTAMVASALHTGYIDSTDIVNLQIDNTLD